jgi:ferredoxin
MKKSLVNQGEPWKRWEGAGLSRKLPQQGICVSGLYGKFSVLACKAQPAQFRAITHNTPMHARRPLAPDPDGVTIADAPGAVFTARFGPAGAAFAAPATLPLLQAAERAGLSPASSCRNGSCRTCMRRLSSGQVMYRIEWPGLSAEEKQAGYILPCVAYPLSDVVLS